MGHTYVSNLVHYVFSTKLRKKLITPQLEERLWPYLGGIARENNMKPISIGGTEDHIHILLSLPATISIAKAIQLIKGGSSKWVHDEFQQHHDFEWQKGYGAFTLSISQVEETIKYIQKQKEHHRKTSFQDEFLKILKKHGIEYDERYIWD